MNTRERFNAIMNFEKPDRNLIWEMGYWLGTVDRWYGEGLPKKHGLSIEGDPGLGVRGEAFPHDPFSISRERDQDVHETMGMDKPLVALPVNLGPQPFFDPVVFEDSENFVVFQDEYGVKKRINKKGASIPEFIDWQVKNQKDFERLKEERFQPNLEERIPEQWESIVEEYKDRDFPLSIGGYPYGFYGFLRYLMGEERLLFNFYDDPALVRDMMNFLADFWIALYDQALSQVTVDCVHFWEDMAYKTGPLISPATFREFMMPAYKKVTNFLKDHGINVILVDSDGNVDQLIPLFLESGLTGMYPFEVQAGNDIVAVREQYPKMQILGGINKIKISQGKAAIDEELESKIPFMLNKLGYIPHIDHLVHPEISWEDFCYYRKRLKEMIEVGAE
jgi:uroporphyrinogen-III decarboxylase